MLLLLAGAGADNWACCLPRTPLLSTFPIKSPVRGSTENILRPVKFLAINQILYCYGVLASCRFPPRCKKTSGKIVKYSTEPHQSHWFLFASQLRKILIKLSYFSRLIARYFHPAHWQLTSLLTRALTTNQHTSGKGVKLSWQTVFWLRQELKKKGCLSVGLCYSTLKESLCSILKSPGGF